jgi:hypothetical protein
VQNVKAGKNFFAAALSPAVADDTSPFWRFALPELVSGPAKRGENHTGIQQFKIVAMAAPIRKTVKNSPKCFLKKSLIRV